MPRLLYLCLVASTCGATVMALELLGTRLLAPVCGTSIHVWAAMITVTLASVAVGYAHGGRAADEAEDVRPLGHLLLVAGRVEVWRTVSQRLLLVDGMLQTAMPVDSR